MYKRQVYDTLREYCKEYITTEKEIEDFSITVTSEEIQNERESNESVSYTHLVWCTVNRYGIFAKMFITSNLEGGTAMLRKLNCFLNIVIGSFIGVFIGFGIYKFWHFKTYPNLYAMQSAPWYTELLLDGALVAVLVVVCIILKLIIWRKLKP